MRKFIKTILISFLTFNLTFTSFASEDQPAKEGTDQKAGEKIIITESVNPIKNSAESPKSADSTGTNKQANPEDKKEDQTGEGKKDESAFRDKKTDKPAVKQDSNNKQANPDMENIEKVVDDLVQKLDKNSNLSKALSEMQTSINSDGSATKSPNEASKQTEAILKDYNEKIQTATSDNQRKKIENEAANKINSINSKEISPARTENDEVSSEIDDIPEKKKKILLEVKPEKAEDEEDRSQILALNPTNEPYEEKKSVFSNPIVIISLIFVIVILVVIGIVIRKNDRKIK